MSEHNINSAMLDLFRMETLNQSQSMLSRLAGFNNPSDSTAVIDALAGANRAIKSAAKLVNVELAMQLSLEMENYLGQLQTESIKLNESILSTLKTAGHLFQKMARLDIMQLTKPDNETALQLSSLSTQLNQVIHRTPDLASDTATTASDALSPSTMSFSLPDSIDPTMFNLLKTDMENNTGVLSQCILQLEETPDDASLLEKMMRASHSIKGAARMVNIDAVVKLAHAMEDCFVAAQKQHICVSQNCTDTILHCIDLLKSFSELSANEIKNWLSTHSPHISSTIGHLQQLAQGVSNSIPLVDKPKPQIETTSTPSTPRTTAIENNHDSVVRVSASRINRLMGLAGELSITSGWIRHHTNAMLNLKKRHNEILDTIDRLRNVLEQHRLSDLERNLIETLQHKAGQYRDTLSSQLLDLDEFDRRTNTLTSNLNHEIIASRMRPFNDGIQGYKRMVRDVARSLNKKVRLDIIGEHTQIDREILEKIDAPINHMIRNAIDHGIESPEERILAGKDETGVIKLEATHHGGQLLITVADDGRGVDIETIRQKVLDRKLVNKTMAEKLSRSELLDFLFLPAFSTRDEVTEISGRGVGLDVVHDTLQNLRGKLHSSTELGKGMQISMILPLTLSVIRSLLVTVNNELYAFPLARIHNLLKIDRADISVLDDRQYITLDDQLIGLIHCAQILGMQSTHNATELSIVIIGDWQNLYGVVVDNMLGERALALRPLNTRLGKIKDINAAALTDDGEPVLVLDSDDLIASIRDIISGKNIIKVGQDQRSASNTCKRVLVVDDSLTVREVEKKLIESRGYHVDVAVDGVDAWNMVRSGEYDLVVTDVDMPRMNGIELVSLIKADAALRSTPVMMVSYKDRSEDKQRGLEAGADYYLTKGSFHDETLIDAVRDLIGEAI